MTDMIADDSGGVGAKQGFAYQDYAAAMYMIQMLRDKELLAVRCEVTDDIDLEYNAYTEYVQVKSADGEGKWNVTELCVVSPQQKEKGKKAIKQTDSILHKSLDCDRISGRPVRFRILTKRDVRVNLQYLRIPQDKRQGKPGEVDLKKTLRGKIGSYVSPAGNDVEFWVDKTYWHVMPTIDEIESLSKLKILQAAADRNVFLNPNRDADIILNDILCTLTKKSAISRKINTADDKSYLRSDFLPWFNKEIELLAGKNLNLYSKVYAKKSDKLPVVLTKFLDLGTPKIKVGMGVGRGYEKLKYKNEYIAEAIVAWLPEMLLRPSELADMDGVNLVRKSATLFSRLSKHHADFASFLGKVLLHSAIRQNSASQPIPATLYLEDSGETFEEFENVHIVQSDDGPDELWLGISKLVVAGGLENAMIEVCNKLNDLVSNNFSKQKKRILDVKEDSYLFSHEINEILVDTATLDDHIERFRFVIFLGYDSPHVFLELEELAHIAPARIQQIKEAEDLFSEILVRLIGADKYFDSTKIFIYLFPTPCVKTLEAAVQSRIKEALNAK